MSEPPERPAAAEGRARRSRAPDPDPRTAGKGPRRGWRVRAALRGAALLAWAALLVAFWLGARGADGGPLAYLRATLDGLAARPWAALGVLGLYLLRPLLLVPITVANLAAGFVLGARAGVPFAMAGTLLSASVGYAVGRFMGSSGLPAELAARSPLVRGLRRRAFESVVAGGLMYLHADMVNLPAGLLRIRFPTFLAGIVVGNALTMTTAVLAGASVEGRLADARVTFDLRYLAVAAALFLVSLVAAWAVRRRWRP